MTWRIKEHCLSQPIQKCDEIILHTAHISLIFFFFRRKAPLHQLWFWFWSNSWKRLSLWVIGTWHLVDRYRWIFQITILIMPSFLFATSFNNRTEFEKTKLFPNSIPLSMEICRTNSKWWTMVNYKSFAIQIDKFIALPKSLLNAPVLGQWNKARWFSQDFECTKKSENGCLCSTLLSLLHIQYSSSWVEVVFWVWVFVTFYRVILTRLNLT